MKDRPNWVWENMRMEFGMPASAISMGIVTCFSTSSAARPGNSDTTVTWVSVTSGKASIGKFLKDTMPAATNRTRPRMTNSGWSSAKATMRLITWRPA